ncbi:hypothetical protein ACS0TY_032173 [Phlomoides rotata]
MNLLLYMAPMVAMILLPFTLYIEGNVLSATVEKARGDGFMVFLLIENAMVAYLVNLTNFLVIKHTSALTLQVLENAKAAVAAVVSVLIFRNPIHTLLPNKYLHLHCYKFINQYQKYQYLPPLLLHVQVHKKNKFINPSIIFE